MQVQVMTTYEKHLYGVTGSTQGDDAPLKWLRVQWSGGTVSEL